MQPHDFFQGNSLQRNLYNRGLDKKVYFNVLPIYGTSRLRSKQFGTGPTATLNGGEIELSSGTDGANDYKYCTSAHAQYRSGLWGDNGIGLRFGSLPQGNQVVRWGLFNDDNGFGWGMDADGLFVFRRSGGNEEVYRQEDWNADSFDGTGPSGLTIDPLSGYVFRIIFRWYGFGPVVWGVEHRGRANFVELDAHRATFENEILTIDPNQRVCVEIKNNGTTSNDFSVFLGGRQYALWGRDISFERRLINVVGRDLTISAADTWEPLMLVRKKQLFKGRENSVRVVGRSVTSKAVDDYEIRVSRDATTDNTNWIAPEDVPASETAVETNIAQDYTVSDSGIPIGPHLIGDGSNIFSNFVAEETDRVQFGNEEELLVEGRTIANGTTVNVVVLELEEQW